MYQLNFTGNTSLSESSALPVTIAENDAAVGLRTRPYAALEDGVARMRVSNPQSLIDTDFEYSTQPSKWGEQVLVKNWPSFFNKGTSGLQFDATAITGGNQAPKSTMTVTTTSNHGLVIGDIVVVQETTNQRADGTFTVVSVPTATTFTYIALGQISGSVFDSISTVVYGGGVYPFSGMIISTATGSGAEITITTTHPHGLVPGAQVLINGATTNTELNGYWVINTVTTPTSFTFTSNATGLSGSLSIASTAGAAPLNIAQLYANSSGYVSHRATDGGVLVTSGSNFIGAQQIRQTRRYFRYQSGKSIQFSTGLKLTSTFDVDTITATGTIATVTTIQDHNMQPSARIKVENLTVSSGTNAYNGVFTVSTVTGTKSFTYVMASAPTDTSPGGDRAAVTCIGWTGATVRSGMFDDQTGFFFEYDGAQVYACRREATQELFGRIAITAPYSVAAASQNATPGTAVTGTGTRFLEQLVVGDRIVIKGSVYEISQISSNTALTITPRYRGPSVSNSRYNKVATYKVPQSDWNMDRLDGTGTSGFTLDVSKMQMAFIDYSWYGAGTIRWGFRATNGDIVYCHRAPQNNANFSAYQRSGNLPARYEAYNTGYYSKLIAGATGVRGSALASTDTTLYVENAQYWPASGVVVIQDTTNVEVISYGSIGAYSAVTRAYPLQQLVRRTSFSLAGINAAGNFSTSAYTLAGGTGTYTFTPDTGSDGAGAVQVSVTCVYNNSAPVVSHWGVSVIMDGKYDDDKSIQFTAGMLKNMIVQANTLRPLVALRIAPTVSGGFSNNFGIRELVNRMQLTLASMGTSCNGQFLIEGYLNPSTFAGTGITIPTSWTATANKVGSGSLAQIIYFDGTGAAGAAATATGTITGGDRVFAFFAENSGGTTNFSTTNIDLTRVRDLGASIISGDGTTASPCYPNGPDVLLITARNMDQAATRQIAVRLSWTEAQA